MALRIAHNPDNYIYQCPDGSAYVPEGERRYWYRDIADATLERGALPVVSLTRMPD